MTTAFVLVRCERTMIAAVAQALADIDGFSEVYSVSGRYDLVAMARVKTEEALADLMTGKLVDVQGIAQTETLIAFRAYATAHIDMGFGLGFQEEQQT
jgi:DNA-binding Lrp family transcriptional regulator